MQHEFEPCTCKVRPITFDEARKYNNLLVNKGLDDWWWTCTPWSTADRGWKRTVAVVSPSGNFNDYYCIGSNGVRPFCILNLISLYQKENDYDIDNEKFAGAD